MTERSSRSSSCAGIVAVAAGGEQLLDVGGQDERIDVAGTPAVFPLVRVSGVGMDRRGDDDLAAVGLDVDAGEPGQRSRADRRVGAIEVMAAAAAGDLGDRLDRQPEVAQPFERSFAVGLVEIDVDGDQAVTGEHPDVETVVGEPAAPPGRIAARAGRPFGVKRRFAVEPDERRHPERLLEAPALGHQVDRHRPRTARRCRGPAGSA